MKPENLKRPWWAGVWGSVLLFFAPLLPADSAEDREAGPFARRFLRLALAVTVVVGVGVGIAQYLVPLPVTVSLVTAANEWNAKALPEHSVMNARPDSNLIARVYKHERRIDVFSGEAFFEVAKDARPFIVHAGTTQTRALGTKFSVAYRPSGEVKVNVLEGEVRFTNVSPNGKVTERSLTAGMAASVANDKVTFPTASYDEARRVYWEGDTLYMGDATMGEVVAQLNLRESGRIVIDDLRVATMRWRSQSYVSMYTLERFLAQVEANQPAIEVQQRDGRVYLSMKNHP